MVISKAKILTKITNLFRPKKKRTENASIKEVVNANMIKLLAIIPSKSEISSNKMKTATICKEDFKDFKQQSKKAFKVCRTRLLSEEEADRNARRCQ